jgi:predicted acyltransferase
MEWYPVPDIGSGLYEKGANFSNYVDSIFLKGHMWSVTKTWDPEGIISTLPAFSTTLFGVLTGHFLVAKNDHAKRVKLLLGTGVALTIVGLIWSIWLPINKSIWTSSYSVFTAGLAMIVFGISYYIIDVKNWQKGIKPFVIYGMNAITVFVVSGLFAKSIALISWSTAEGKVISLKSWIFNTFFQSWLSPINASLAFAIVFIAIFYVLVYVMYQKKIFIKV